MSKKIKTSSGFVCTIQPECLEDMELIELLARIDDEPLVITKVLDKILGEKMKKKLYDHVREKDGRVPVQAVSQELSEIFTLAGEDLKN